MNTKETNLCPVCGKSQVEEYEICPVCFWENDPVQLWKPQLAGGANQMPYAEKNNGLFEVKECINDKTQWSGTQTLITPKGRETFRLLYLKALA